MQGFLVGLSKLVMGVLISLLLLSLAGVATARYFMGRLAVLPPRPTFENEAPAPAPEAAPEPAPTPDPEPTPTLDPGAYMAVVVQPIGLVIREAPGIDSQQLGGVDYDAEVVVLETSEDERWIRVRVVESGQEGWVKAGNTRSINPTN